MTSVTRPTMSNRGTAFPLSKLRKQPGTRDLSQAEICFSLSNKSEAREFGEWSADSFRNGGVRAARVSSRSRVG